LRSILAVIDQYVHHNYAARLPALPVRELDVIGGALNHLATALDEARRGQQSLTLKLLSLQEEERANLARELHDEFGQCLTAMRADAAYLSRRTAALPEVQAVARNLEGQCASIHVGIRDLLRQLRPQGGASEDGFPLNALLLELVEGWRQAPDQQTEFDLTVDLGSLVLPQAVGLTLYRMTQEALTNVARHAQASKVAIKVSAVSAREIAWQVSDDGVGINALEPALSHGKGLAGMRERVWAHEGEISISAGSADPQRPGTLLFARLRLASPESGAALLTPQFSLSV
jgi:two-component system sensor histidine kinase UhpB